MKYTLLLIFIFYLFPSVSFSQVAEKSQEADNTVTIGAIFAIFILLALFKGVVQTFQRNAVVAVLLIIFLSPLWVLWVIMEMFRSKPNK